MGTDYCFIDEWFILFNRLKIFSDEQFPQIPPKTGKT